MEHNRVNGGEVCSWFSSGLELNSFQNPSVQDLMHINFKLNVQGAFVKPTS